RMTRRKRDKALAPTGEEWVGTDEKRISPSLDKRREDLIEVVFSDRAQDTELSPRASAAACASRVCGSATGLVGLTSSAINSALGNSSRISCILFCANTVLTIQMSVVFPPGRLKLATKPNLIGSAPVTKTMGIVAVAALAASTAGGPNALIIA